MGAVEKKKRNKSFVFLCICLLMEMCSIFPLYALANLAYRWDEINMNISHTYHLFGYDLYGLAILFGIPMIIVFSMIAFISSICILVLKKSKVKREKNLAICILAISIIEVFGLWLSRQGALNYLMVRIWPKLCPSF